MLDLAKCFILPPGSHSEDDMCFFCNEKERDDIFVPCNHMPACRSCSDKFTYCPICRHLITAKVNLKDIPKKMGF